MSIRTAVAVLGLGLALAGAQAQSLGRGKLLLTGGVSTIDGAAGGGLTPWAVTGSYATQGEVGATAFATRVITQDYALTSWGAALGLGERAELSLARQDFDTGDNLAPLGLPGLHLKQDILGVKLRLAGDAVLDSDTWFPQLAVGLLHKRSDSGALEPTLTGALGADRSGTEFYLSATKLLLAHGVLANLTLRATRANQGGLLGFGGAQANGTRVLPELSLAKLLARDLAVGLEFRAKPDNLNASVLGAGALQEDDWADLFAAWAPNKHVSLTLAWVDLGRIAPAVQPRRQRGGYLSVQLAL
ncbi:MAG: DUF3034 family protein [Piscinibacter sp.]|uniref:DUF3034 family protein n=1 Tax=Piscinibacter sp. TaxID=1903157 RepID=UPI00258552A3|nr:DUF3034 family protein [Piscinibacter sp.]MCW5662258.1 DUF3034 family protein [Piscinibacter sp.]